MRLVRLDSSIKGEHSVSRRITSAILERFREHVPALSIVERDLVAAPLPPFTSETLAGFSVQPEPQTEEYREERIDRIVLAELLGAVCI